MQMEDFQCVYQSEGFQQLWKASIDWLFEVIDAMNSSIQNLVQHKLLSFSASISLVLELLHVLDDSLIWFDFSTNFSPKSIVK